MPGRPSALLLVLLLALGCGRDRVASSPSMTSPASSGTLPELEYFLGAWHADAENPATKERFELEYVVEPMLQGVWYRGTGRAAALDLDIHDMWGKDPVTGEISRTIFDSAGNVGTVRSKGWDGATLVLVGDVASRQGAASVRETITKVGPDEFRAVWEMRQADGAWSAYSVETLRRVSAKVAPR